MLHFLVLNIKKLSPGENTVRSLENAVEIPKDLFVEGIFVKLHSIS